MNNAILISYGRFFKRSSKPVMQGSRVESIEETRKEYKKLLEEEWKKTYRFNSFFKKMVDRRFFTSNLKLLRINY